MQTGYELELRRKAFHLSAIVFPFIYLFISKPFMVALMMIIAGCTIYIDRVRHTNPLIQEFVDRFFKNFMREREFTGTMSFTGSSYMMAGFFISALLFSKGITIAAWLVLIISDSVAAIVGKQIGTPRANGKSFEGSAAFFISSLMICLFSYTFAHYSGTFMALVLTCAVTTALEYYSEQIGVDDNLSIPVVFGSAMTVLGWIL